MRIKAVFILSASLVVVSCSSMNTPEPTANSGNETSSSPPAPIKPSYFEYQQGACFGLCPVFKIRLSDTGLLTFDGQRYTSTLGTEERELGADTFKALSDLISSIPEEKLLNPRQCPVYATDHPSYSGIFEQGDRSVAFRHYYGCSGYAWQETQIDFSEQVFEILEIDDLIGWKRGG